MFQRGLTPPCFPLFPKVGLEGHLTDVSGKLQRPFLSPFFPSSSFPFFPPEKMETCRLRVLILTFDAIDAAKAGGKFED